MPAFCAAAWLRTSTLAGWAWRPPSLSGSCPWAGRHGPGASRPWPRQRARFLGPAQVDGRAARLRPAALGFSALPYPLVCLSGVTAPSCSTTGVEATSWVFGAPLLPGLVGVVSEGRGALEQGDGQGRCDVTARAFAQP